MDGQESHSEVCISETKMTLHHRIQSQQTKCCTHINGTLRGSVMHRSDVATHTCATDADYTEEPSNCVNYNFVLHLFPPSNTKRTIFLHFWAPILHARTFTARLAVFTHLVPLLHHIHTFFDTARPCQSSMEYAPHGKGRNLSPPCTHESPLLLLYYSVVANKN